MLTGNAIHRAILKGDIRIEPYDESRLCANSYAFTLAADILRYDQDRVLDPHIDAPVVKTVIDESGFVVEPGRLYLAATRETMGATRYAATLHACRSVSCLGLRIQVSAPLGHCGAVIPWTLELRAALPVRIYPGMIIGKIAFWPMHGPRSLYTGRYTGSGGVVRSLMAAHPSAGRVIACGTTSAADTVGQNND